MKKIQAEGCSMFATSRIVTLTSPNFKVTFEVQGTGKVKVTILDRETGSSAQKNTSPYCGADLRPIACLRFSPPAAPKC